MKKLVFSGKTTGKVGFGVSGSTGPGSGNATPPSGSGFGLTSESGGVEPPLIVGVSGFGSEFLFEQEITLLKIVGSVSPANSVNLDFWY